METLVCLNESEENTGGGLVEALVCLNESEENTGGGLVEALVCLNERGIPVVVWWKPWYV